jgi:hypothetical protein
VIKKVFKIEKEILEKELVKNGISKEKRAEELLPEEIYISYKIVKKLKGG